MLEDEFNERMQEVYRAGKRALFTAEEIEICRKRLRDYGYPSA